MNVFALSLAAAVLLIAVLYGLVWTRWWIRDRRRRRERLAARARQQDELERQLRRLRLHLFDQLAGEARPDLSHPTSPPEGGGASAAAGLGDYAPAAFPRAERRADRRENPTPHGRSD